MSDMSTLRAAFAPVHRAGWPFLAIFFGLAVTLGFLWKPLFWVGLLATAWCAYFFRDPARVTPLDPAVVASPCDGAVQTIAQRVPPAELELGDAPLPCVSIFMNVFDVHVNRTPVPGRIVKKAYRPGAFFNASLDKASEDNERMGFVIAAEHESKRIALVQIAGLIARRIVAFEDEGARLEPGQRIGLIRFGSRCDVYLPKGATPRVIEGQRAIAGETVLARLDARGGAAPTGRIS